MVHLCALSLRLAVLASAGALLFFCGQALAQGAGFETAPGSQMITSTGQAVIPVGPATPSSGVAAQSNYGGFSDAQGGMYAPPLGYNGPTGAQAAPVYAAPINAAPAPSGAPLTPTPGYSVQSAPTTGPYAAQAANPYPQPAYPLPQPYAFGAPMPDYAPQPSPYGPQPTMPPAYAQPYAQPYAAQPPLYAQQPQPYAAQSAPYAAPYAPVPQTQSAVPQQSAQRMPANYGAPSNVPYSSGTTAYGAVLPRNVSNMAGQPQVEGGYTLGPGDKIKISVFNEPELSGEYQIDGNGNIRFPLLGMFRAVGYTAGGLEGWLRAALVPNYVRDPRINVEIMGYRPIYVVGAVVKPGQYTYVNDMTLAQAVALAGGYTPQAKESTVYVRHEGETTETPIPVGTPLLIRPGDTVRVDTTWFWDAMNFLGPLTSPVALAATAAQ